MSICCEKCGLVRAWAAYFLMALTSMFCFIATVPTPLSQTMGGWPGHKIFDSNGKAGLLAMCQGSSAAVEAAAYLFQGLQVYCKGSSTRAKTISTHIHQQAPMHESELARPVQICVNEFVALSKVFTERLVIVFEGLPYTFKEHTVAQGSKQEEL